MLKDNEGVEQEQQEPPAEQQEEAPAVDAELIAEEPAADKKPDFDEEPDFGEGLLDPENGKLLGKFNDANALARSYKDLESHAGRTSTQAADYKKTLEGQGYTFDEAGRAIAPQAATPQAVAPVFTPDPAPDPALPNGQQLIGGVLHDHLGMPVIPQEEWDALEEDDPESFGRLQRQQDTLRIVLQREFDVRQEVQQRGALDAAVQNVRRVAKEQFFLDDDNIVKLEASANELLQHVAPSVRSTPQAYEMAMRAVASDMLPVIYQQQLRDVIAGNKDAVAKAQRVVALEKGTQNAPAAKPASSFGLSADEKAMAKDLGVSEKDYAANK